MSQFMANCCKWRVHKKCSYSQEIVANGGDVRITGSSFIFIKSAASKSQAINSVPTTRRLGGSRRGGGGEGRGRGGVDFEEGG